MRRKKKKKKKKGEWWRKWEFKKNLIYDKKKEWKKNNLWLCEIIIKIVEFDKK